MRSVVIACLLYSGVAAARGPMHHLHHAEIGPSATNATFQSTFNMNAHPNLPSSAETQQRTGLSSDVTHQERITRVNELDKKKREDEERQRKLDENGPRRRPSIRQHQFDFQVPMRTLLSHGSARDKVRPLRTKPKPLGK